MTTLIDAKHIGNELIFARNFTSTSRPHLAKLLRISQDDLKKFERGKVAIPAPILDRIFIYAILMMRARSFLQNKN